MSLRIKLALILLPALAGLVYFAAADAWRLRAENDRLEQLARQIDYSAIVGQLVHELQTERGLSAGYLAARGQRFGDEIARQRGATDAIVRRHVRDPAEVAPGAALAVLRQDVGEADRAITTLAAQRTQVDALTLSGKDAFAAYSAIIERLLAVVGTTAAQAQHPALSARMAAYYGYANAKEYAGRERATLNNAFVARAFDEPLYQRLLGIIAAQDAYHAQFDTFASASVRQMRARTVHGADVDEARALRAQALAAGLAGPLGVEPARWFRVATARIELMRKVEEALAADAVQMIAAVGAGTRAQLQFQVGVLGAAFVLALGIGWWVSRGILRQLGGEPAYAAAVVQRIAEGDLTLPVRVRPGDRASVIAEMGTMQDTLARMVASIHAGTTAVGCASRQIAAGNEDLSQRTEEQAASLEETAASMEQLTATVRDNTARADEANRITAAASDNALRGGRAVRDVVATMRDISTASKRIADIIGVIDGIAFQTNILALNAAVEAARAGEEGRGFAVVAAEVRGLAQRSASAAKEIGTLIGASVASVGAGAQRVHAAGAAMEEVVASVQRVTGIMAEIAAAGHEQASGIEQVNLAMTQMDTVTQQNAALVEEAAAATAAMADEAEALELAVAVFRVHAIEPAATAPTAAPAPTARRASPGAAVSPAAREAPAAKTRRRGMAVSGRRFGFAALPAA